MFCHEPLMFHDPFFDCSMNYGYDDPSEFLWSPDGNFAVSPAKSDGTCSPMCSTPTPIPTASAADAAASLQTAFCKKPNDKAMFSETMIANIKHEPQLEEQHAIVNNNAYPYASTMLPGQQELPHDSEGVDAQQMDIYRDLILRHLIQDISTTCARLGLPTDPNHWSTEHTWIWVSEMCQQFSLPVPRPIGLTGRALLHMDQRGFEHFAGPAGDTLHAQLQLWKTAFETYQQNQHRRPQPSTSMTAAPWPEPDRNFSLFPEPPQIPQQSSAVFCASTFPEHQPTPPFFQPHPMPSPSNSDDTGSEINDDDLETPFNFAAFGANGMPQNGDMSQYRPSGTVHLWHFIRELLDQPKLYSHCVRWVNRDEGTFKIESSHVLARIWGQRKNRSQMNYDKLSRSLRQYYKKGIIQKPAKKQRLVYKFMPPYNL